MRPFARLQCVCFLHKLQIKTVQHRADRNAEEHAHDAEGLAANRDRHQNEQPRKTDGFADNLWVNQIGEVGPELKRGTPVLIGERVEIAPRKDAVREVEERTRGWRAAWRRGEAGDGFIAPERAASIRKVERQEKRVRVTFGPVRALEGPGYVVSWFAQRTASPDGGAETGVRRLYWEKQGDGEYRIVGMAWAD